MVNCFHFLFYVLVLLYCYLEMLEWWLRNDFKFKSLTLALKSFRSSWRYISKPVYVCNRPCKGRRNETTYIIYKSTWMISIKKFIRAAPQISQIVALTWIESLKTVFWMIFFVALAKVPTQKFLCFLKCRTELKMVEDPLKHLKMTNMSSKFTRTGVVPAKVHTYSCVPNKR